ncbi:MAG: hypothetical protein RLZZ618_3818, partial [Pseudomonadota bacterium]
MTHIESAELDTEMIARAVAYSPPTASERLQASREALQAWIQHTYHADEHRPGASAHQAERARIKRASQQRNTAPTPAPGWLGVLEDSLSDVPMATVAVRWVRRWWTHHPWRATVEFAHVATEELVGPVARRHPWIVLGSAVAVGALATKIRPWRWVSRDAVIASMLPTISVASILHWVTNSLHRFHPADNDSSAAEAPHDPDGPLSEADAY